MRKTYKAYAKLNLHLDVPGLLPGPLPGGYHSVAMLMQSVDLADIITVEQTQSTGVEIRCNLPYIPKNRSNIVWKAAEAFFAARIPGTPVEKMPGLRITLEKKIPSGAGMAGGSADAAAVFAALREMYAPEMTDEALRGVGAKIGADVPFCLLGGCCWAEGIGEQLTPLQSLPAEYQFAAVKPAVHINTANAYAQMDRVALKRPDTKRVFDYARQGGFAALFPHCANVFEQVIFLPGLAQAKEACAKAGALLTQMTGSGSAVFALHKATIESALFENGLRALGGDSLGILRPVPCGIEKIN